MTSARRGIAPGRVVVVTGPPGAGKTTVARLLVERLSPSVHLHADDFWHAIRRGWIAPYLPRAHEQNATVIEVVAGAAARYARGGYEVVCDGIVGPWFLDVFRAAVVAQPGTGPSAGAEATAGKSRPGQSGLGRSGVGLLAVELHYVVLRPDRETTLSRASARGTDPPPPAAMGGDTAGVRPAGIGAVGTGTAGVGTAG